MTFVEIAVGVGIALGVICIAIAVALLPTRRKAPGRHDIRGNGDYTDGHVRPGRGFDAGEGGDSD